VSRRYETIEQVVDAGLCMGCGTCAGVCPAGALAMCHDDRTGELRPVLDRAACKNCHVCAEVCPGSGVDFGALNEHLFGRQPDHHEIGVCRGAWVGHSTDEDMRYQASSGGVVTELSRFLLDEKEVDGVLVAQATDAEPLRPQPVVARTRERVAAASGSKYCPLAMNTLLREVRESGGRFALVGLPCHVHGWRMAARRDPRLAAAIRYSFGLFCGGVPTWSALEYFLARRGVRLSNVRAIQFRSGTWPGAIRVVLKDGQEYTFARRPPARHLLAILRHNAAFTSHHFRPLRCLTCCDVTAELADASFGDPWLPRFLAARDPGQTVIVARSQQAEELVDRAVRAGRVAVEPLSIEEAIRSQSRKIRSQKALSANLAAVRFIGRGVPAYAWARHGTDRATLCQRLGALLATAEWAMGRRRWLWPLILPWTFVRTAARFAGRAIRGRNSR
jgi:coenzyme F420 hydrogenase subunit beta